MRRDGDDGRRRDDTRLYRWMQFIMSLNERRASARSPTWNESQSFERALNSTKYTRDKLWGVIKLLRRGG